MDRIADLDVQAWIEEFDSKEARPLDGPAVYLRDFPWLPDFLALIASAEPDAQVAVARWNFDEKLAVAVAIGEDQGGTIVFLYSLRTVDNRGEWPEEKIERAARKVLAKLREGK